jgi:hypothetical protein
METLTQEKSGLHVVEQPHKQQLPASREAPTSLLQAIAVAASNPAFDVDKVERLWAMQQQIVAQQTKASWNAAMARAQANMQPIVNNKENSHTKSRYADLAAINAIIVPIYAAEGLSISFNSGASQADGWYRTVAKVAHADGHSEEYHLDLPLDDAGAKGGVNKTGVQAMGSTSSYARRYLERMIFNLSTGDDNDGNKEKGDEKPKITDEQKADWDSAIEAETDVEKLKALGASITKACNEAKDLDTYNLMKKKYQSRMAVIKEAK